MKVLGHTLKHLDNNYYDATDLYWNVATNKADKNLKKAGFTIIRKSGLRNCFQVIVKKD